MMRPTFIFCDTPTRATLAGWSRRLTFATGRSTGRGRRGAMRISPSRGSRRPSRATTSGLISSSSRWAGARSSSGEKRVTRRAKAATASSSADRLTAAARPRARPVRRSTARVCSSMRRRPSRSRSRALRMAWPRPCSRRAERNSACVRAADAHRQHGTELAGVAGAQEQLAAQLGGHIHALHQEHARHLGILVRGAAARRLVVPPRGGRSGLDLRRGGADGGGIPGDDAHPAHVALVEDAPRLDLHHHALAGQAGQPGPVRLLARGQSAPAGHGQAGQLEHLVDLGLEQGVVSLSQRLRHDAGDACPIHAASGVDRSA